MEINPNYFGVFIYMLIATMISVPLGLLISSALGVDFQSKARPKVNRDIAVAPNGRVGKTTYGEQLDRLRDERSDAQRRTMLLSEQILKAEIEMAVCQGGSAYRASESLERR